MDDCGSYMEMKGHWFCRRAAGCRVYDPPGGGPLSWTVVCWCVCVVCVQEGKPAPDRDAMIAAGRASILKRWADAGFGDVGSMIQVRLTAVGKLCVVPAWALCQCW
jgi:hypothetical protein